MKTTTRLMHAGRRPAKNKGIVNPPVYHASTVVFPTYEALLETKRPQYGQVMYGRRGTPTGVGSGLRGAPETGSRRHGSRPEQAPGEAGIRGRTHDGPSTARCPGRLTGVPPQSDEEGRLFRRVLRH